MPTLYRLLFFCSWLAISAANAQEQHSQKLHIDTDIMGLTTKPLSGLSLDSVKSQYRVTVGFSYAVKENTAIFLDVGYEQRDASNRLQNYTDFKATGPFFKLALGDFREDGFYAKFGIAISPYRIVATEKIGGQFHEPLLTPIDERCYATSAFLEVVHRKPITERLFMAFSFATHLGRQFNASDSYFMPNQIVIPGQGNYIHLGDLSYLSFAGFARIGYEF